MFAKKSAPHSPSEILPSAAAHSTEAPRLILSPRVTAFNKNRRATAGKYQGIAFLRYDRETTEGVSRNQSRLVAASNSERRPSAESPRIQHLWFRLSLPNRVPASPAGRRGRNLPFEPVLRRRGR